MTSQELEEIRNTTYYANNEDIQKLIREIDRLRAGLEEIRKGTTCVVI